MIGPGAKDEITLLTMITGKYVVVMIFSFIMEHAAHFDLDPNPTTTGVDTDHQDIRRTICSGCDRPVNVCLCHTIPTEPISTCTQIVILHHPHERRHKLATVPVLAKCLRNCKIITGRRLRRGDSPLLDSLHDNASDSDRPNGSYRAAFLFPGTDILPSIEISQWRSSFSDVGANNYVLIALDGTWKHAKEMLHASLPFLSKFATQVCLPYDAGLDGGTIFDSDLILRKEPFSGCMSTFEAVARCLRVLEPNGNEVESSLVEVLRSMVSFQASFLKCMKPRAKLLKKGEEEKKKSAKNEHLE